MFDCPICCEDTTCGVVKSGCCNTEICLQCFTDIGSRVAAHAAGPCCPFCRGVYPLWNPERQAVLQTDIMMRAGDMAKSINTRAEAIAHMTARLKHYQASLEAAQRSQQAEMQMYQVLVREAVKANCVDSVQALIRPVALGARPVMGPQPLLQRPQPLLQRPQHVVAAPVVAAVAPVVAVARITTVVQADAVETTRCAGCTRHVPNGQIRSRLGTWPRTADGVAGDRRRLVRCDSCASRYP